MREEVAKIARNSVIAVVADPMGSRNGYLHINVFWYYNGVLECTAIREDEMTPKMRVMYEVSALLNSTMKELLDELLYDKGQCND